MSKPACASPAGKSLHRWRSRAATVREVGDPEQLRSYSVLAKCVQFKGTAKATVDLSFSQEKQTVYGALIVDEVNLENVPPLVSALVTAFVRQTIAAQINPFEVLRVSQLALSLPIKTTGGSVTAVVKDVRSEVQEGSLRLVLTYDFSAQKNSG